MIDNNPHVKPGDFAYEHFGRISDVIAFLNKFKPDHFYVVPLGEVQDRIYLVIFRKPYAVINS